MRAGRPKKLRLKKRFKRGNYGMAKRGAKNPKQLAANIGRRRVRRARGR